MENDADQAGDPARVVGERVEICSSDDDDAGAADVVDLGIVDVAIVGASAAAAMVMVTSWSWLRWRSLVLVLLGFGVRRPEPEGLSVYPQPGWLEDVRRYFLGMMKLIGRADIYLSVIGHFDIPTKTQEGVVEAVP